MLGEVEEALHALDALVHRDAVKADGVKVEALAVAEDCAVREASDERKEGGDKEAEEDGPRSILYAALTPSRPTLLGELSSG